MLRMMQPSFAAGELSPSLHARVDLGKYAVGLKRGENFFVCPEGGVKNRPGLRFVAETRLSGEARQIPFIFDPITGETYSLVFTNQRMRVIRGGAPVLLPAVTVTSVAAGATTVITKAAHGFLNGDEILISAPNLPILNGRSVLVGSATTNTFNVLDMQGTNIVTTGFAGSVAGWTMRKTYEITTPYTAADAVDIVYAQENDILYMAHEDYAPRKLSRLDDTNWVLLTITFAPSIAAPAVPVVTKPGDTSALPGYKATVYRYRVSAVSAANGDESLPSPTGSVTNDLDIATGENLVSWTAVAGAGSYVVYKRSNGIYGYIGTTGATSFTDDNLTPDLSQTPQQSINPFATSLDYPRCVTLHEQRLCYAGTKRNPSAVYMSQSGFYENFGTSSPATARDAITFRIRAREKNQIRALVPLDGLVALTNAAEWFISGGSEDFLTPTNVVLKVQSYRGSSVVQPLTVGDVVLFVQARGNVVRALSKEPIEGRIKENDLTILAKHLFDGRAIKAWAYAQSPESIVWVVLDSGDLVSLTFHKEHEVWAWMQHFTDGLFEDVIVIPEGDRDVPYFVVHREVQNVVKHYIEKLESRHVTDVTQSFFVDSGLTYDDTANPVSSVGGLWHLEGCDVVAVADGGVIDELTVANGAVALDAPAGIVHVGLPYDCIIETLKIDMGMMGGLGSVQGRAKMVGKITTRVVNSSGLWAAATSDDKPMAGRGEEAATLVKHRFDEPYGEANRLFTGDLDVNVASGYDSHGSVILGTSSPLPMHILGVYPEILPSR